MTWPVWLVACPSTLLQFGGTASSLQPDLKPSIAAAISDIPSDWINLLGHWTSKSFVGYVRTMLRRIGHIQASVAHHFHAGLLTIDSIGEDDLYAQWAAYMCTRGVSQSAAVQQASVLAEVTGALLKDLVKAPVAPATPVNVEEDDAAPFDSPAQPDSS